MIATAPEGFRLTVVKVTTDQDRPFGYGCGTFTQRAELVNVALERYLRTFLAGKPADRIDDLRQAMYNSSAWIRRSGTSRAGWQTCRCNSCRAAKHREAVNCCAHASGNEIPEVIDNARRFMKSRGPATLSGGDQGKRMDRQTIVQPQDRAAGPDPLQYGGLFEP